MVVLDKKKRDDIVDKIMETVHTCFVMAQVSLALSFSLSMIEYYHLEDHPFISS